MAAAGVERSGINRDHLTSPSLVGTRKPPPLGSIGGVDPQCDFEGVHCEGISKELVMPNSDWSFGAHDAGNDCR